ncbi:MAG: alkaline phosphatase, partial [Thermoguttaceae bacterium]|nr:alkaline phosphatase [Thermoguttaceae bacterium]
TLGFVGTGYKPYIERLASQTCSKEVLAARCSALAKKKGNAVKFEDFQPLITEATGLLFDGDKDDPMNLKDEELATLKSAFDRHKEADMGALVSSVIEIFDGKAGLAWTSGSHTALPVKTSAAGVGAELFQGRFDNTDVAKVLKSLVAD